MRSDHQDSGDADEKKAHQAERELVERARTDAEAFAALYQAHVARIYRFVLRQARSHEVAEDVTATTFERALRGIDRFEWRAGGFSPWLHRIAANELAEHYRTARRDSTPRAQRTLRLLSEPANDAPLDALAEVQADREHLAGALSRLSPRHQEALSLRYLAGMTPREAAAAMGCTRGGFAVLCHRALAALRAQLGVDATAVDGTPAATTQATPAKPANVPSEP